MQTPTDNYSIVRITEPGRIVVECCSSTVRQAVQAMGGRREMFRWPGWMLAVFCLLTRTSDGLSDFLDLRTTWVIRNAETDAEIGAVLTKLRDAGAVFLYDPKQYVSPHEAFESLRAKGIVSGAYRQIAYGGIPVRAIVRET